MDKSHEIMVMWMELTSAIGALRRARGRKSAAEIVPWSCEDPKVKVAWRKLTSPENLQGLEDWLEVARRDKKRIWTSKAIEECKNRQ
jgi:hypothetical protein